MPRTVRDARFDSREARKRLKPSGKPYYRLLDPGVHFGYRKGRASGSWVVRVYRGAQTYVVETIGQADDGGNDADGERILDFAQGQARARKVAVSLQRGVSKPDRPDAADDLDSVYTVRQCLDEYIEWMESKRKSAADARSRVEAHILPALGSLPCVALSKGQIDRWLHGLAALPARIRSRKSADGAVARQRYKAAPHDDEGKRRRRATANRTLTILKAALNRAWREGNIASDDAWRRVEPFEQADAARVRYLAIGEAQRLISASAEDFQLLVRAALATGARYGELAALKVGDFNVDSGTVHVRTSKSGKGRHVVLANEGLALFSAQAAARAAGETLLVKADGGAWRPSHQARPMRDACQRAGIKPAANFHCLRHTFASHALMNGAPLFVVAKALGHTDTRMVELHYGHLSGSFVADAIRAAAPRFGFEQSRVVSLSIKQTP